MPGERVKQNRAAHRVSGHANEHARTPPEGAVIPRRFWLYKSGPMIDSSVNPSFNGIPLTGAAGERMFMSGGLRQMVFSNRLRVVAFAALAALLAVSSCGGGDKKSARKTEPAGEPGRPAPEKALS